MSSARIGKETCRAVLAARGVHRAKRDCRLVRQGKSRFFREEMVNIPKNRNTYCRKCKKHTPHKAALQRDIKSDIRHLWTSLDPL